jgi:hypothetical protein
MQKLIIIFFLLVHGMYGSDKMVGYKEHQINEKGKTVWLPEKYENYDQFREECLENRALERLEMLYKYKQRGGILSKEERKNYTEKLQTNELGLAGNSTPENLQAILGKNTEDENVDESIKRIAKFLKVRFQKGNRPDKDELIGGLDCIIGICGSPVINEDANENSSNKREAL